MKWIEYIFPVVIIVLQLWAGIVYLIARDFRRGAYWLAAAVVNLAATM